MTERDLGVPSTRIQEDALPGPLELDALVSWRESSLHLQLSRSRFCRRREITTVRRVRLEESKISTGTIVASSVLAGVGVLASSIAMVGVGGAIFVLGLAQSGTTTTALPEKQTLAPATRVRCHQTPAAWVEVQVFSDGVQHQGTSDASGTLVLDEVERGPLRVVVGGEPVRVREGRQQPTAKPATPPPESKKPAAKPQAPVHPKPRPSETKPLPETSPLPPPPPPPPGVRLLPQ